MISRAAPLFWLPHEHEVYIQGLFIFRSYFCIVHVFYINAVK